MPKRTFNRKSNQPERKKVQMALQDYDDGDVSQRRRVQDKWHVGKEIPLVLTVGLLAQTPGGIWWMSQMASKIDQAVLTIAEFRNERYTREDARRDRELLEQKFEAAAARDRELDRRLSITESRQDRISSTK